MKMYSIVVVFVGLFFYCSASPVGVSCPVIIEPALSRVQLGAGADSDSSEAEASDAREACWERLILGAEGNELIAVEFETFSEPEHSKRFILESEKLMKDMKAVYIDEKTLRLFRHSFSGGHCLRNIVPPNTGGGWGSQWLFGNLSFVTKKGRFTIGLGTTGFSIDGGVPGTDTEFYSPAGAELLNMLYYKETDCMLRDEHLEALCGQKFINWQLSLLHRLQWKTDNAGKETGSESIPER